MQPNNRLGHNDSNLSVARLIWCQCNAMVQPDVTSYPGRDWKDFIGHWWWMYIIPNAERIVSIEILHYMMMIDRYKVKYPIFVVDVLNRFEQASNDLRIFNYTSMHGSTSVKVDQVSRSQHFRNATLIDSLPLAKQLKIHHGHGNAVVDKSFKHGLLLNDRNTWYWMFNSLLLDISSEKKEKKTTFGELKKHVDLNFLFVIKCFSIQKTPPQKKNNFWFWDV